MFAVKRGPPSFESGLPIHQKRTKTEVIAKYDRVQLRSIEIPVEVEDLVSQLGVDDYSKVAIDSLNSICFIQSENKVTAWDYSRPSFSSKVFDTPALHHGELNHFCCTITVGKETGLFVSTERGSIRYWTSISSPSSQFYEFNLNLSDENKIVLLTKCETSSSIILTTSNQNLYEITFKTSGYQPIQAVLLSKKSGVFSRISTLLGVSGEQGDNEKPLSSFFCPVDNSSGYFYLLSSFSLQKWHVTQGKTARFLQEQEILSEISHNISEKLGVEEKDIRIQYSDSKAINEVVVFLFTVGSKYFMINVDTNSSTWYISGARTLDLKAPVFPMKLLIPGNGSHAIITTPKSIMITSLTDTEVDQETLHFKKNSELIVCADSANHILSRYSYDVITCHFLTTVQGLIELSISNELESSSNAPSVNKSRSIIESFLNHGEKQIVITQSENNEELEIEAIIAAERILMSDPLTLQTTEKLNLNYLFDLRASKLHLLVELCSLLEFDRKTLLKILSYLEIITVSFVCWSNYSSKQYTIFNKIESGWIFEGASGPMTQEAWIHFFRIGNDKILQLLISSVELLKTINLDPRNLKEISSFYESFFYSLFNSRERFLINEPLGWIEKEGESMRILTTLDLLINLLFESKMEPELSKMIEIYHKYFNILRVSSLTQPYLKMLAELNLPKAIELCEKYQQFAQLVTITQSDIAFKEFGAREIHHRTDNYIRNYGESFATLLVEHLSQNPGIRKRLFELPPSSFPYIEKILGDRKDFELKWIHSSRTHNYEESAKEIALASKNKSDLSQKITYLSIAKLASVCAYNVPLQIKLQNEIDLVQAQQFITQSIQNGELRILNNDIPAGTYFKNMLSTLETGNQEVSLNDLVHFLSLAPLSCERSDFTKRSLILALEVLCKSQSLLSSVILKEMKAMLLRRAILADRLNDDFTFENTYRDDLLIQSKKLGITLCESPDDMTTKTPEDGWMITASYLKMLYDQLEDEKKKIIELRNIQSFEDYLISIFNQH